MRVLVTGASGFIGHVLCAQLLERGHHVSALVRRPGSEPDGTERASGDLSDVDALEAILAERQPQCVIHLAAQIASQRNEAKIAAVNIAGTAHLLQACKALAHSGQTPRFVFASTVVTGDAHGALLREDQPLPITSAYGRSKHEGERMVLSCGLPAVVVRPSHVYGPGGWYEHEIVARLRQPGRLAVIGEGKNLWDVVRVEDVASALVLASESASSQSIYHVVDDEPITFYDFVALTAEALGVGAPRRVPAALARLIAGSGAVQAALRSARSDNAKLRRELGWEPRFASAREGVPDAVAKIIGGG